MTDTQTQTRPARSARIEVFRPGTFKPMNGGEIAYSAADLRAIADAYDPATAPAPIVVGHPSIDAPAFGWIEKLTYDAQTERLMADLHQIEPAFAEAVQAGRYKKVSMSFFKPDSAANPVPGTWYPKHVGFLGGAAPALPGLKNVSFASPEAAVVFTADFGSRTAEATAGLLRTLRDMLIEKFGLDEADKALPGWNIEWLAETGDDDRGPAYAAPPEPTPTNPESTVPQTPDPALAAREAEFAAREQRLAAREAEIAHADNVAFADSLVADGKLIPASRDHLVGLLDVLRGSTATVSFSADEAVDPVTAVRKLLSAQPKVVSFGAMDDPGAPASGDTAEFAADGRAVDPTRLALHQKALDYQRQHPGTAYIAAVQAVS